MESRVRGSGRGSCPVPLLRRLEQRTMSPAADICNHVRAVAMVHKQPASPGQGARTKPGIQVTLCGRCHLALPHPSHSTHMPVSHRGFSRCQSRPRQALVQHVSSSASPVPLAPFACPFASWSCGSHCSGPWERGSGVESKRSVTSAVSAWLPRSLVSCTSPLSLLLSAIILHLGSATAPACQGALPHCLPRLGSCLPRSGYSWLSDPDGCRGG